MRTAIEIASDLRELEQEMAEYVEAAPLDVTGTRVLPLDTVSYPVRRGSSLQTFVGTVEEYKKIKGKTALVVRRRDNNRRVTLQRTDCVSLLPNVRIDRIVKV